MTAVGLFLSPRKLDYFQGKCDRGGHLKAKVAVARKLSGSNGDDPQRTARATDDFEWSSNDDGAGRRELIKVA